MLWRLKPVLVVGDGPVCDALTERLVGDGAHVYLWKPFGGEFNVSFDSSYFRFVRKDVSRVSGRESFLKRPMSIFVVFPGRLFEDVGFVEEVLGKVLGAACDRKTRIVVASHLNGGELDFSSLEKVFDLCKNSDCNYGFCLAFNEVYGPNVHEGFIFRVLEKLKENSMRLELDVNPAEVRDFIYIDDAVGAILKSCEKVDGWRLQVVPCDEARMIHVVRALMVLLGLDGVCEVRFSGKYRAGRKRGAGGIVEVASWFKPKVRLSSGLKRTVDWFEANFGPIVVCPNNNHYIK